MRRKSFFIGTLLLTSTLHARGHAPDVPPPSSLFVEQADSFAFRAIEDDAQCFYALWTHAEPDKTYSLYAQRLGADGQMLWRSTGTVLEKNLPSTEAWDVVADGKSGLVLSWVENERLHVQRFAPDGTSRWDERMTVTSSTSSAAAPTVVSDAAGGGFFVWSEHRYADRWVLMSQHIDGNGRTLWPAGASRVSLRPSDQRLPRAVYDGSAGLIVAWKDFLNDASQLQLQRLDYQGNRLWGAQGEVVAAPAGKKAGEYPLIVPVGDGQAAMAWTAQSANASRLFVQLIDARGKFRLGPQGKNLSFGNWDEWNPKLSGNGAGTVLVGWEDYRTHTNWQVFLQRFDRDAHALWPASDVAVAPISAAQGHLSLTGDGQGGAFAAWCDNRTGKMGVYVQEVDAQGKLLLGFSGKTIADQLTDPKDPQAVEIAPGRAAILYADRQKKGQWALYAATVAGPAAEPFKPAAVTTGAPVMRYRPESDIPRSTTIVSTSTYPGVPPVRDR
jgi:hypothetical protein